MPIIFGWGRRTVKSIGVVFKNLCNNCHNEEYWVMTKVVTWFTLFFIPIIPYETKYFLSCPVCKYGVTLDDNQLEKLKPIAETNQLFAEGKITQEDYAARLNELNSGSINQVEAKVEETKALTENTPSLVICPECGHKVGKKAKFCAKCGKGIIRNN
ncbi:MAG TPA: zinc-ribbon domain-containing protein [Patescibacteria group bacterium]|nr:zinc-ribbon domain-containing protein [Patescibacteria group bacterium]